MAYLNFQFQDNSKEFSTAGLRVTDGITALLQTDIQNAVTGVSIGNLQSKQYAEVTRISNQPAASDLAQRENKWLVRYEDTVTFDVGTFTIPCADLAGVTMIANTDRADLTAEPMLSLVNIVNAQVLSKAGNPVSVIEVKYVGRNL